MNQIRVFLANLDQQENSIKNPKKIDPQHISSLILEDYWQPTKSQYFNEIFFSRTTRLIFWSENCELGLNLEFLLE